MQLFYSVGVTLYLNGATRSACFPRSITLFTFSENFIKLYRLLQKLNGNNLRVSATVAHRVPQIFTTRTKLEVAIRTSNP